MASGRNPEHTRPPRGPKEPTIPDRENAQADERPDEPAPRDYDTWQGQWPEKPRGED